MFVVTSKYLVEMSVLEGYYEAHREWLQPLYDNGTILGSGPQKPRVGGVILMKGNSVDEVRALLKTDPFSKNGIAEYSIIEFEPNPFPKRSRELDLFLSR